MEDEIKRYLYKYCHDMWCLYIPVTDHIALENIYDFYFNDIRPNNGIGMELLYYGMYCYANKDYNDMKIYYKQAINMGYHPAMYNLGLYYKHIKKNYTKMKKYYRKAINHENKRAMKSMAGYYKKKKKINEMKRYHYKAIFGKRPTYIDDKISKSDMDYASKGLSTSMQQLGYFYYQKKKFDKMKLYYNMAIEYCNHTASMCSYAKYYKCKNDDDNMMKYCIMYLKNHKPYSIDTKCTPKKKNGMIKCINKYFDINTNIPLLIECYVWLNNKHLINLVSIIATYLSNKIHFAMCGMTVCEILCKTYRLMESKSKDNTSDPNIKDTKTLIEKIDILPIGNLKKLFKIIIKYVATEDHVIKSNVSPDIFKKINDINNKKIFDKKKRRIKRYIETHKFQYIDIESNVSIDKIYDTYFNKAKYPYGTQIELLYYGIYYQIKTKYDLMKIYYNIAINEGSILAAIFLADYYTTHDMDNAIKYYIIGAKNKNTTAITKLNNLLKTTNNLQQILICKDYLSKDNNKKLVKCIVQYYKMQDNIDSILQTMDTTLNNVLLESTNKQEMLNTMSKVMTNEKKILHTKKKKRNKKKRYYRTKRKKLSTGYSFLC